MTPNANPRNNSQKHDKFCDIVFGCIDKLFIDSKKKESFHAFHLSLRKLFLKNSADDIEIRRIKSMFLIFSETTYDILDIFIFNSISNVQINFTGVYSYLNPELSFSDADNKTLIIIDSQVLCDDSEMKEFIKEEVLLKYKATLNDFADAKDLLVKHLGRLWRTSGMNPICFCDNTVKQGDDDGKIKIKTANLFSEREKVDKKSEFFNPVTITENKHASKETKLENVNLTEENINIYYDIDGICGFANELEIMGLRGKFVLNFSHGKSKTIHSRNQYMEIKNQIVFLKDCFALKFAEVPLMTCFNERIDLFLVFGLKYIDLDEDEREEFKKQTSECINAEINETIKQERLIEVTNLFKDTLFPSVSFNRNQSAILNSALIKEKNTQEALNDDVEKNKLPTIQGRIDNIFVKNLIKRMNEKFDVRVVLFFESYAIKSLLCSTSLENITRELNNIFDISKIKFKIDLCVNIGLKNMKDIIVGCSENFMYGYEALGINSYCLMNCSNFKNFNGSCVKEIKNKSQEEIDSLSIHANGIFKVNIYSPLITQFLPKNFRYIGFPSHSSLFLLSNIYNWQPIKTAERKLEKLKKELVKSKQILFEHFSYTINLRGEFRISTLNIASFKSFIDQFFLNKTISYCKTKEVIDFIQQGIQNLIDKISDTSKNSIFSIANLAFFEIFLFERYLRGGSNMHILPKTLRNSFLSKHTSTCIKAVPNFSDLEISIEETFIIARKLVEKNHNMNINTKTQSQIDEFLNLIEIDIKKREISSLNKTFYSSIDSIIPYMIENLLNVLSEVHKINISDFYFISNSRIPNQVQAQFTSQNELFKRFFVEPADFLKKQYYYGIYSYLVFHDSIEKIHDLIFERMRNEQIAYFPRFIGNKGVFMRKIAYKPRLSEIEINSLFEKVKDGWSFEIDGKNNPNIKKAKNTVLCEHILIYHGLHYEKHSKEEKQLLYDDRRYPFFFYTHKYKIEGSFKRFYNKNIKLKETRELYTSSKVRDLKINELTLDQIVEYLNSSGRYIKSVEVLKNLDMIMGLARSDVYSLQSDEYYVQLYNWQRIIPNGATNIDFLFEGTNFVFDTSIENEVFQGTNNDSKINPESDDDSSFRPEYSNSLSFIEEYGENYKDSKYDDDRFEPVYSNSLDLSQDYVEDCISNSYDSLIKSSNYVSEYNLMNVKEDHDCDESVFSRKFLGNNIVLQLKNRDIILKQFDNLNVNTKASNNSSIQIDKSSNLCKNSLTIRLKSNAVSSYKDSKNYLKIKFKRDLLNNNKEIKSSYTDKINNLKIRIKKIKAQEFKIEGDSKKADEEKNFLKRLNKEDISKVTLHNTESENKFNDVLEISSSFGPIISDPITISSDNDKE